MQDNDVLDILGESLEVDTLAHLVDACIHGRPSMQNEEEDVYRGCEVLQYHIWRRGRGGGEARGKIKIAIIVMFLHM